MNLRKTFFWSSYRIWKFRKFLVSDYWKCLNLSKKRKKNQKNDMNNSCCNNPFHFLSKIADLSNQRLTRCFCSKIEPQIVTFPDIRKLFMKNPHKLPQHLSDNGLDRKHNTDTCSSGLLIV